MRQSQQLYIYFIFFWKLFKYLSNGNVCQGNKSREEKNQEQSIQIFLAFISQKKQKKKTSANTNLSENRAHMHKYGVRIHDNANVKCSILILYPFFMQSKSEETPKKSNFDLVNKGHTHLKRFCLQTKKSIRFQ